MCQIIDKDSKETLSSQLFKKLVRDIKTGALKPGKRIPGDRILSKKYGVSRGTVIEALALLEKQNYIERIPSKGSFVAEDARNEANTIRIVFPFPEETMTVEALGNMENWAITSETYRGMVAKAREEGAEISFMHFEETLDEVRIARQLRKIENFDGAIFMGRQLEPLMREVIDRGKPCAMLYHSADYDAGCPMLIPELREAFAEIAAHLTGAGYKRIWSLSPTKKDDISVLKERTLLEEAEKAGITASENWIVEVEKPFDINLGKILSPGMFEPGGDAVFFNHTDFAAAFYEFCMDNCLRVGRDVGAFGYASGFTFQGLTPPLTHSMINHFARGSAACEMIVRWLRTGVAPSGNLVVKNKLATGRSTCGRQ